MREAIGELAKIAGQQEDLSDSFREAEIHQVIRDEITALAGAEEQFTIWDRRYRLIADSIAPDVRIGKTATPWGSSLLTEVFDGESKPFAFDRSRSMNEIDSSGKVSPHLAIVAPVRFIRYNGCAKVLVKTADWAPTVSKSWSEKAAWGRSTERNTNC